MKAAADTPERRLLLARLWPGDTPTTDIRAALDALPGPPVTVRQCQKWAEAAAVHRPPAVVRAAQQATRRLARPADPGPAPPGREAALLGRVSADWPLEKLVRLAELWDRGFSCGEIATALHSSKNAVVGKVHRLKLLTARPSPIRPRDATARPVPPPRAVPVPVMTLPPLPSGVCSPVMAIVTPAPAPPPPALTASCRYPLWADTEPPSHRYCGAPTPLGQSWCRTHHAVCFTRSRRQEAA